MTIAGLPLHPLIVHATVVMVPLGAMLVIGATLLPRLRAWLGPLPMLVTLASLVLVPITTQAGESLEHSLGVENAAIEKHADLGGTLIWIVAPLAVLTALTWWLDRRGGSASRIARITSILASLVGVIAVVQLVRIGHSGATAVWSGVGG